MSRSNDRILIARTIPSELTHPIRKMVLWPHITNGDYSLAIDKNPDTFHIGTYIRQTLISIGTFVKENNPKFSNKSQYRLRAMATDSKFRGWGAGKCLFLKAVELLKTKKTKLLWCDARIKSVPFYKNLNMHSLEKIYEIINIGPHKTMYIYLDDIL